MFADDHIIIRGDYTSSIPAHRKALQSVAAARAAAPPSKIKDDLPERDKRPAAAASNAKKDRVSRNPGRVRPESPADDGSANADSQQTSDSLAELQHRIHDLERLEEIVEAMCVFSVVRAGASSIHYTARIHRAQVEALLHYILERTRRAGAMSDSQTPLPIAYVIDEITIE